jgi:hypothetical protein
MIKKDYYAEYEKQRAKDPNRSKKRTEYQRKFRDQNPAYRARQMTGNAIRDGRLVRGPCEICGDNDSQAHHDDYSKPLDVRWLCESHHREWHKINGKIKYEYEEGVVSSQ